MTSTGDHILLSEGSFKCDSGKNKQEGYKVPSVSIYATLPFPPFKLVGSCMDKAKIIHALNKSEQQEPVNDMGIK